jgi:hypothetical protein
MEWSMVLNSLAKLKIKWPRLHYVKKPVNIRMILALDEAEKRMDRIHIALDELRRVSSLR